MIVTDIYDIHIFTRSSRKTQKKSNTLLCIDCVHIIVGYDIIQNIIHPVLFYQEGKEEHVWL
jgi:hypothetical protein